MKELIKFETIDEIAFFEKNILSNFLTEKNNFQSTFFFNNEMFAVYKQVGDTCYTILYQEEDKQLRYSSAKSDFDNLANFFRKCKICEKSIKNMGSKKNKKIVPTVCYSCLVKKFQDSYNQN